MKRRWAYGLLGAGLLYVGLPYALVQLLGLGLVRQGSWGQYALSLTFDDGPDPQSTPHILDALSAEQAKATFFVLTPRALAHPELIRRMLAEGHQVELHATEHRHAWLDWPQNVYAQPLRGRDALRTLGIQARYHRPPHGAYTLATLLGQRHAGLKGAHWDVEARDWHPQATPADMVRRVLRYAHPGAVVVLHDAGPGARNTVPALPELLRQLKRRGYRLTRLDKLPGAAPLGYAGLPRRFATLLDQAFDRAGGVEPIMERADSFFRLGVISMPLDVTLRSGEQLKRGQTVLDIHVNSPQMVDYGLRAGVRRARTWDFPLLAQEISQRPEWQRVGYITTIGGFSGILKLLGFEEYPIPASVQRRLSLWGLLLKRAYGAQASAPQVKLSVISTADFLRRYLGKGQPQADGGPPEGLSELHLARPTGVD